MSARRPRRHSTPRRYDPDPDRGPSEDMRRFNLGHRINGVPLAECSLEKLAKELNIMIDIGERQGGKHSRPQQVRTTAIREEIKRKMKETPA